MDLNVVCYLWWDIAPVYPVKEKYLWGDEFDNFVLETMREILQINSLACQESALHGLGHWQECYPNKVGDIIGNYIQDFPDIPQSLNEYAIAEKFGEVQ